MSPVCSVFVLFLMKGGWNQIVTLSNQHVAAKSTDAISRREVGKVAWKSVLNELIDSEKEDIEDLKALRRRLMTDPESLRLVGSLLERKVERVIELNLLLRYRDKEKEMAAE